MRGWARNRAFGLTLTAITTVAVMTACSSSGNQHNSQAATTQPASNQSSTTTVPATTAPATTAAPSHEFVSKRYGFAVSVPQGWTTYDAEAPWDGEHLSGPGSLQMTALADPTGSRTLMAAAAPVPAGMQLAEWQAAMVRGTPSLCSQSASAETTTLGGEPALAWTVKCSDGLDAIQLAALHRDRGYVFYLGSATANDDAQDRQIFEGIRQSFRFTG
jgi:hypothetical protein